MFDERSSVWIKIYKGITEIMLLLFAIGGVTMTFIGWGDMLYWTRSAFLDGIICLAIGCVGVISQLFNMLIVQLLSNVQSIRQKLEEKE